MSKDKPIQVLMPHFPFSEEEYEARHDNLSAKPAIFDRIRTAAVEDILRILGSIPPALEQKSLPDYLRAKEKAKGGCTAKKKAVCAKCEEPFEQYNSMHVFCDDCSPSKKQRNQEITRTCAFCDRPFKKTGKGCHKYCQECREKYPKNMAHKSKAPCKVCGKSFIHVNKEAQFCYWSCSSTSLNRSGLGPRHNNEELRDHLVNHSNHGHPPTLSVSCWQFNSGRCVSDAG